MSLAIIGCKNMSRLLCLNDWGKVFKKSLVTGMVRLPKWGGGEFRGERIFTIPRPNGQSLGVHGVGSDQQKLGVHGFGAKCFPLYISLNWQSFDVYDTPCKVDGGKNKIMWLLQLLCNLFWQMSVRQCYNARSEPGVSKLLRATIRSYHSKSENG